MADTHTTADTIAITGLRFTASHGVFEQEKLESHPFIVDIEADVATRAAGLTDDLNLTLSYADLAADARAVVEGERVELIETLAERIAERVLARDPLAVTVTVHKPEAPVTEDFDDAWVRIRRVNPLAVAPEKLVRAVVALGGNLGDVQAAFDGALESLARVGNLVAVSDAVRTTPQLAEGQEPQPDYLNAVALLDTSLSPLALLDALLTIEAEHGRQRTEHWGPRTLDLDLIAYGDVEARHARLELPHPRAAERLFVLEPWGQVDPNAQLAGQRVRELIWNLRRKD